MGSSICEEATKIFPMLTQNKLHGLSTEPGGKSFHIWMWTQYEEVPYLYIFCSLTELPMNSTLLQWEAGHRPEYLYETHAFCIQIACCFCMHKSTSFTESFLAFCTHYCIAANKLCKIRKKKRNAERGFLEITHLKIKAINYWKP